METPFEMTIFDKRFGRQGFVSDPISAKFTPRFNAQGAGELVLKASDPSLEWLLKPGARLVARYRDEHLMSGRVILPEGDLLVNGSCTLQISDDWRRSTNTLAWVRAGGDIAPTSLVNGTDETLAQAWYPEGGVWTNGTVDGQYGYYLWPDGSAAVGGVSVDSAEAAIKWMIQAQIVSRTGQPVTVAEDLGRGGDALAAGILPLVRFEPVAEVLAPILAWSGLGLRYWQDLLEPTIHADVFEPKTWTAPLTVASGIIQKGSWSLVEPTATRLVVGGPGEDAARAFAAYVDAAREDESGEVIEIFRDASSAPLAWPSGTAATLRHAKYFMLRPEVPAAAKAELQAFLDAAAAEAWAETSTRSSVSAALAETEGFSFGGPDGYHVGDAVTIESGPLSFSDRIMECELAIAPGSALSVLPTVGQKKGSPDRQLAEGIMGLARAQRRIVTRR